ncbi:MAG TPA: hypothetical protein VL492_07410, partial [Methylovirgula sp.]|nr:hypothetical protein [Methylovirgula sp.]
KLRALAAGFRQRDLAVASVASFALMLIAGTAVLSSAGLHKFVITPSKTYIDARPAVAPARDDSPWGAAPDSRIEGQSASQASVPFTSASYTTGFDKSAVGLGPLPAAPKQAPQTDARTCPDNLNCSFRPAKAGAVAFVSPPRKVAIDPPSPPAQKPNNFAFLTPNLHWPPQLPLANNILKPFSYVGDRVTDFVKKL